MFHALCFGIDVFEKNHVLTIEKLAVKKKILQTCEQSLGMQFFVCFQRFEIIFDTCNVALFVFSLEFRFY